MNHFPDGDWGDPKDHPLRYPKGRTGWFDARRALRGNGLSIRKGEERERATSPGLTPAGERGHRPSERGPLVPGEEILFHNRPRALDPRILIPAASSWRTMSSRPRVSARTRASACVLVVAKGVRPQPRRPNRRGCGLHDATDQAMLLKSRAGDAGQRHDGGHEG